MWEDFMRGNWPAAAATPGTAQSSSAKSVTATPTHAARPTQTVDYAEPAGQARAFGYARAQATPRPVAGKLAFRATLAAGAGLVLAVLIPGSAVAGSIHATGAHVAAHAATAP